MARGIILVGMKSGSCRCAVIGVPWCLRRLSLFSTFIGWSFIGNNLIKFISIILFFKQNHANRTSIVGNNIFKQIHTSKAPNNKGKSPYIPMITHSNGTL